MSEVTIYTDGGCDPNPGSGGWAAILLYKQNDTIIEKEISGNLLITTNNRAEITAMLEGLKALKHPCHVTVYTDSQYLKGAIGTWNNGKPVGSGWIVDWRARGWRRKKGALLNTDLWKEMWDCCKKQSSIRMKWIRGHNEDHYNDRCDVLATKARLQLPKSR